MSVQNEAIVRSLGAGRVSIEASGVTLERSYSLRHEWLEAPLGRRLVPIAADLVDIASTVYVTDRLVRRPRSGWQRRLKVDLAVRRPEIWARCDVRSELVELLEYLTEDEWTLDFSAATRSKRPPLQMVLPLPRPITVGLFSGGLDSLAGAALRALSQTSGSLVLVSFAASTRLLRLQRSLLLEFVRRAPIKVVPTVVPFRLAQLGGSYNDNERSQRSRGFLFGALAASVALSNQAKEVFMFEDGLGAINLPLVPAQLGAQSSRSAHPYTVAKLEALIVRLTRSRCHISLKHVMETKGELCSSTPTYSVRRPRERDRLVRRLPTSAPKGAAVRTLQLVYS